LSGRSRLTNPIMALSRTYSPRSETATIAPSPSRQGVSMPSHATAAQASTEKVLYRIGEVSRMTSLKPFVLRYWETEFPMLQPVKSESGHRLYRQQDVDMVLRIKRLLYDEGFTIAGARRTLRETPGSADAEMRSGKNSDSSGTHAAHGSSNNQGALATLGALGEGSAQLLNRKMLLDLRDTLRAFLTLLERR
jgi:DNA-binding transcriptional MerR regulator